MRIVSLVIASALGSAALGLSLPSYGADAPVTPNWNVMYASHAAMPEVTDRHVQELFSHVREADHAELDRKLDEIIGGDSLSAPARDAVLFRFTVGLADFDEIDADLVNRLRKIKPSVFISHEERAHMGVPMFDISGAAEGIHQLQVRRAALDVANATLGASSDGWVNAYVQGDRSQRKGYEDALENATGPQLERILSSSLAQLGDSRGLTPVAGKSALLLGDVEGLQQLVVKGDGPEMARILETAAATLAPEDILALLESAVNHAPAVNASLAIAQLHGRIESLPETQALLLATLGHAELGSAAALALAHTSSNDTRTQLEQIASQDAGLASSRAQMAISMRSSRADLR